MTTTDRLLLLSCSQRKRPDSADLPALERYNGPLYQILRKFYREYPVKVYSLDTYIISAQLGLIPMTQSVPSYDQRMTHQRALELIPGISKELSQILDRKSYQEIFICMGAVYLLTLGDYQKLVPANTKVTVACNGRSYQQVALHDWLYPEPSSISLASNRGDAHFKGRVLTFTPEQVLETARQALMSGKGNPTNYAAWYVQVDQRKVSPKWLVSQLTEVAVSCFHTDEAKRVLQQLGVEVCYSKTLGHSE